MNEVCNFCGGTYAKAANGRWVCQSCDAVKNESITSDENNLLSVANQKLRLGDFDGAEDSFRDIINHYPNNDEAHWGLALSKFGIRYEEDCGKRLPTCCLTSMESLLTDEHYQKAIANASKENLTYFKKQADLIERIRLEWVEKASKEIGVCKIKDMA